MKGNPYHMQLPFFLALSPPPPNWVNYPYTYYTQIIRNEGKPGDDS